MGKNRKFNNKIGEIWTLILLIKKIDYSNDARPSFVDYLFIETNIKIKKLLLQTMWSVRIVQTTLENCVIWNGEILSWK